jgi:hypothetical protein
MKNGEAHQPNGGAGTKAFFIAHLSGTRTSKTLLASGENLERALTSGQLGAEKH